MGQRILLAIDDSVASSEAAHVTADLAHALKARVTVLHVYTDELSGNDHLAAVALVERVADVIARSETYARPEVRFAAPQEVAGEILEAARTLPADMIVLGSRGRRPLSALLLGSVSHAVVANAQCPVLIVRSAFHLAHRGRSKILLAIEGDTQSEALFSAVVGLARALSAEVEVVHVSYPGQEDLEKDLHRARVSHGAAAMDDISERLRGVGIMVTTRRLTGLRGVAGALVREADAEDAGLIVIGSGQMTGFVARLAGSVAETVLHSTRRPVLLAPEPHPLD